MPVGQRLALLLMPCLQTLTEPLEARPMTQDGELLPGREQDSGFLQTVGVVELGKPQQ